MTAKEFIEMQKQDLETNENKSVLLGVVAAFEEVLKGQDNAEIEATKTAEECYIKMRDYARDNAKNGMYCFTPKEAEKYIAEYLGITASNQGTKQADEPKPKKRRNLEDFF